MHVTLVLELLILTQYVKIYIYVKIFILKNKQYKGNVIRSVNKYI